MNKFKEIITNFAKKWILAPAKGSRLAGIVKMPILRYLMIFVAWVCAALLPCFAYLVTEYIHFATIGVGRFMPFLQTRSSVALGMITLYYLFWAVLLLICKKPAIAGGILSGLSIVFVITNHFKYTLTGDFFFPWDLVQTGNMGELSGFLSNGLPGKFILAAIALMVFALIPALVNAHLPIKFYVRIPIALVVVFCMLYTVNTPDKVEKYCVKHSMDLSMAALQQSNYTDNGFVGGFTLNVLSMQVTQPEGYSAQTIDNILNNYEAKEASENFSKPDVIVILSESFWDPKLLPGSTFTDAQGNEVNPIEHFDEIASRPGAVSGMMANTALGGGTIRPEFEVLTGLSTDYLPSGSIPYQYLDSTTDAYPQLFKSMGYSTFSVHPYTPSFYSRQSRYPYIGIDTSYFETDFYDYTAASGWQWQFRGKYIADISFMEYMQHILEENSEAPAFMMGISMEAHQPYETKFNEADLEIFAHNPSLSEGTLLSFRNFTMAMYDADNALAQMVDYIDAREKDTILIYFGDHLPTLGANYAAYIESGLIETTSRMKQEERLATQRTPFLIYANFALEESELLHEGTDNEISAHNLMNAACQLMGAPSTQYMQWLTDFGKAYPTYNSRMLTPKTEELQAYTDTHQLITYDRVVGKNYSAGK